MRNLLLSTAIIFMSIGFGGAAAVAQPQPLSQSAASADASNAPNAGDNNRLICRLLYHNGALIRTPACHTKIEWDRMRLVTEREIEGIQIRSFTTKPH
ncbi:MAG TPA: hypothetical protein VHW69_08320 [Rhizomicrobium sp.]|jgi:hypothetical protein|nr:hypothetical protein [Rhizomicrobium sp.]